MKRYGYLFEHVCSFKNLILSAHEAARGKKSKPAIADFLFNLENEIIDIEQELLEKRYNPRPYSTFMVHDPKVRMICAADFRDRVVHHAVCSAIGPIFERSLIFDTYACRIAKGSHRAIKRAQYFSRRYHYFLKLDVRKFFDTIDHKILKNMVRRKIKDDDLLRLIDTFIDHPVPWTEPGRGIPIGNLTSQHFANFYLSGLDHYVKEQLQIEGYIRYMDDSVLFADEKYTLWDAKNRIESYLSSELGLKLKGNSVIVAPGSQGLSFLGFRIFPGIIRIQRQGWRRFRRKVQRRNEDLANDMLDIEEWTDSMQSMTGHLRNAATRNLRDAFFKGCGRK
ncbi:RNA-directed DNA polymerase [Candidatus Scalindua japonica]|uniref:RNA-directed DNA polymerase n=1 Tax=Candidatus Scalindua japonica TaxID=1284222 RepID=A0A286TYB5_9BACT|nr:reverse transcriptase/maturase family protein [Candidatus Scalindua japonica]GAX60889.1 RNA-directed DNA polymerase [Candidatus Scalindua japonica]